MPSIRVNRRAAERLAAGAPWVYRAELLGGEVPRGAVVRVLDGRNVALGWAHYSTQSRIALRMLPFEVKTTDQGFFRRMLRRAQAYRDLVVEDSEAFRLVHGEADLLPGLVIDRYGEYFAVQTTSQGMDASKEAIAAALVEAYAPRGVIFRNDAPARDHEDLPRETAVGRGEAPPEDFSVSVGGLRVFVDLLKGQKTGLFLDQRENAPAAARYVRGKALDCFSHEGGFALRLAPWCERVEAIDSSAAAVERIGRNAELNGLTNIEARQADVFELLNDYSRGGRRFDAVTLDPPAFAKSRRHAAAAAGAYKELNLKALRLLGPDGVLVSCSCSHHFSEADLLGVVAEAALDAGKRLRIIERRTQARDHPIALTMPETHYLKCLILQLY